MDQQLILSALSQNPEQTLWLADENSAPLLPHAPSALSLLTNRWDIWAEAQHLAGRHFCDWDLSVINRPPQRLVYSVSKEKAVVAHLLNEVADKMPAGTELILLGQKNEGIKSLAKLAGQRFDGGKLTKAGNSYHTRLTAKAQSPKLDDSDYTQLRPTLYLGEREIFTKPGTFGWHKLDQGSLQLIACLPQLQAPQRVLDMGCGYGLLTLAAQRHWPDPAISWLATDNCAAALTCARANCKPGTEIFAGNCGLNEQHQRPFAPVDLIICNPPFHQGFATSGDITERFINAFHRWLSPEGRVLLVVNAFVGVEKRAAGRFRQCQTLNQNKQFKVLLLSGRV